MPTNSNRRTLTGRETAEMLLPLSTALSVDERQAVRDGICPICRKSLHPRPTEKANSCEVHSHWKRWSAALMQGIFSFFSNYSGVGLHDAMSKAADHWVAEGNFGDPV